MAEKIRVVIIDDSLMFRTFLQRVLVTDEAIDIVGVFADPVEAMEKIPQIRPNVMTVDMEMPKMRGNEFLRNVLPRNPGVNAVVISALSGNVFDAMQAGAIDFVGKPNSQPGYTNEVFREDIIGKIKAAATVRRRISAADVSRGTATSPAQTSPALGRTGAGSRTLHDIAQGVPLKQAASGAVFSGPLATTSRSIVAIGASTGGTEAILQVIQGFPENMPGVVIVQHMPPGFTRMYAERAERLCRMTVREAQNRDKVEQGLILIAPGGSEQCRVVQSGGGYSVELREGPKVSGHCPSVDVLFESIAAAAGSKAVGVLLTGMGADGAQSLKLMRNAGAHTIGQDEATCVVYGMPKVAYDIGGVAEQLPLGSIGSAVIRQFSK